MNNPVEIITGVRFVGVAGNRMVRKTLFAAKVAGSAIVTVSVRIVLSLIMYETVLRVNGTEE